MAAGSSTSPNNETVTLRLPSGEEVDALVPSGMSDGQIHDLMRQKHPEYFSAPQPEAKPQPPGILSRFWQGVGHGMGDNSDIPPEKLNSGSLRHPNIANNPMIPGSGVYRDIKAGNYAGASGRVLGPAANLAVMFAGGRAERPIPTGEAPALLESAVAAQRVRASEPGFPNRAEGLPEIEEMQPEATAKLRSIIEEQRKPIDVSRAKIGQLLNQATGAQPLERGIPIRQQLNRVTPAPVAKPEPAIATPKESSVVKSFNYNPETRELEVMTKNGGHYIHGDVTPEQAQSLESAESKGKAWNAIKNNSTLVAKVQNGKRIAIKPSGSASATPEDLTPQLEESVKQAKARKITGRASSKENSQ